MLTRFVNLTIMWILFSAPHNIFISEAVQTRLNAGKMVVDIWKDTTRSWKICRMSASIPSIEIVNIMFGCNSYGAVAVPYVRGGSREPRIFVKLSVTWQMA